MTTYRHNDIAKIIVALLLVAGLSAGCGRDNEPSQRTEIAVTTRVSDMVKRITSIDNTSLRTYDLRIDAYYHDRDIAYLSNTKLHYTGEDPTWQFWSGDPGSQTHYYWPIEGSVYDPSGANFTVSSLDFVGFCPYTPPSYITPQTYAAATGASFSATMPTEEINTITYMTPATQTSLQEYLIAVLKDQTYADQDAALNDALPLVFKHPFALIKFVIAEGSGENVKVDSIGIADLYTQATCRDNGTITWVNYVEGTKAPMNITLPIAYALKWNTAYTETTPFMVIPCSYGQKTLTVRGTWNDWSDVTKDIRAEVAFNWEPGYIYTYNLTVTPYALKVDVEKFTEQW